ncbi:hypothetical protein Acor_26340 [Acrocarpospora corrugata]|uniref:DUF4162 domain-containing protein n=1 Tax=Acrocarpospora corrugata TaxID=35763 RepID=A0A5M3VX84_9ACTN|nr:hypothetical protein [Acrocarpospora corrugata]GES00570.1 hypothetical protein Acor_26340 [Acrocarpospora corrugata]
MHIRLATTSQNSAGLSGGPSDGLSDGLDALRRAGLRPLIDEVGRELVTPVEAAPDVIRVIRALDDASIEVAELRLTEPTLDDVYMHFHRQPQESLR